MWLCRAAFRIPVQYAAGIITDKYNKKHLITITNFISVFVAFMFIFVDNKYIYLSYFLAFLLQSLNDVDENAENSIIPEIVNSDLLNYANSVFSVLSTIGILISPVLAGVIYKFYGNNVLFIINAVSFLFASVCFSFIMYKQENTLKEHVKSSLVKQSIEGIKVLQNSKTLKEVFICTTVMAVLGRFYETLKVAVADNLLRINAEGITYFDYAMAIGGLIVPIFMKLISKYDDIKIFKYSSISIILLYIVFGYSNIFVLTFAVLVIMGFTTNVQGIYTRTIMQKM